MTHENEKRLVARVVDNEATEAEKTRVCEHIAACPECKSLMEDLLSIREELNTAEQADVSPALNNIMMEKANTAAQPKASRVMEWLDGFRFFKPVMAYSAMALALGAFIGSVGFRLGNDAIPQQPKSYLSEQESRLFDASYPGSIAEAYQEIEKGKL